MEAGKGGGGAGSRRHLLWPLLGHQVAGHSQGILIDGNHLPGRQDLQLSRLELPACTTSHYRCGACCQVFEGAHAWTQCCSSMCMQSYICGCSCHPTVHAQSANVARNALRGHTQARCREE